MPDSTRFELNNPPVIAETIESEVVAINVKNGKYYSLLGPAAAIWRLLMNGHSPAEILAQVDGRSPDDALEASLRQFVETLSAEELIRPAAGALPKGQAKGLSAWPPDKLRVERFTDMQDMLALDPMHQIDDEFGWPRPAS